LKIAPFLLSFLIQHRRDVEYLAAGMGSAWTDKNLVFPNPQGGYLHNSAYARAIKNIIAGTDIPPATHAHSLRHTFASLMIKDGTDIKSVQESLGHGSAKMTLDIYAHSFAEARAEAMVNTADTIGRAAGGALGALLLPDARTLDNGGDA
jgi:integrase